MTKRFRWTYLVVLVLLLGMAAQAQDVRTLPTASAMARVTKKVAPTYPAAAKQLNIQGTMEVEVTVDATGSVEDAKVLKGNAMFSQSCLSAVRQWKFTPLESGKFTSVIVFNFTKS